MFWSIYIAAMVALVGIIAYPHLLEWYNYNRSYYNPLREEEFPSQEECDYYNQLSDEEIPCLSSIH